jgi:glycosyltransferase involved in cell wall biosynthesis
VQKQSLYNIEIIIVKDNNTDLEDYSNVIEKDERIRIFTQNESYGLWRKRMDGFLYSKGKYILHMDAGHILSDY